MVGLRPAVGHSAISHVLSRSMNTSHEPSAPMIPPAAQNSAKMEDTNFETSFSIPTVMDPYPVTDWCQCTPKVDVDGKEYPPKGPKADG